VCSSAARARKLPRSRIPGGKHADHEAYARSSREKDPWYLPDAAAVSVVTTPNPEGGVTYLFEDVTKAWSWLGAPARPALTALIRVQRDPR